MSIIRDLWVGLPAACGVPDGLAKWDGERNGGWFDFEKENPGSILKRVPGQTSRQRLAPAFKGWKHLGDAHVVEYAERFTAFLDSCIQFNSKSIGSEIEIQAEAATLRVLEPGFPTISALMTVDQAVVQSNWA